MTVVTHTLAFTVGILAAMAARRLMDWAEEGALMDAALRVAGHDDPEAKPEEANGEPEAEAKPKPKVKPRPKPGSKSGE